MLNIVIPLEDHPVGKQISAPVAVSGWSRGWELFLESCTLMKQEIWPVPEAVMTVSLDCSYNGGASYHARQFVWTQGGGRMTTGNGRDIAIRHIRFFAKPAPTHVRWSIEVKGRSIRTSGTVTIS